MVFSYCHKSIQPLFLRLDIDAGAKAKVSVIQISRLIYD